MDLIASEFYFHSNHLNSRDLGINFVIKHKYQYFYMFVLLLIILRWIQLWNESVWVVV